MNGGRLFKSGWVLAFGVILLIGLTACQSAEAANIAAGRVKLAGSTTVEPAAVAAAAAFMKLNPNVEVTVRGGGSTIGVKSVAYEGVHIGMVSRPLRDEELQKWPNLQITTIGRDGVAIVVNHALYNAGVQQLTLDQVADIWRGEITNWEEVGGPDLPIVAFDKELGRGTRDTFAKVVLGDEDASAPGTMGALGENETVISAISEEPGGVSILSTGWKTDDVTGVAIVDISGQIMESTAENVAKGQYPISRDLSLITDGPPQGWTAEFVEFMLSPEGQVFVEQEGYSSVVQ